MKPGPGSTLGAAGGGREPKFCLFPSPLLSMLLKLLFLLESSEFISPLGGTEHGEGSRSNPFLSSGVNELYLVQVERPKASDF